ncbi:TSUP family transporter [Poseidonibacter antarcticus]|uniref:TSUP family transporter n=1 Tax=Poseidonibacter antarcticus TaxID=2478538 RepID=UPI000EF4E417|nr:TSUP family transporter [Poseidonibacter antarcticus]
MDLSIITYELMIILFAVAVFAGFIDTLAGGGGLITIPALILTGMPPLLALGTNKFQAFIGSGTASVMMLRKKKITFNEVKYLMLMAFVGSVIGTICVQFIDVKLLNFVIPIVLLLIGVYFLFMPKASNIESKAKITEKTYQYTAVPFIGFYDGMFGPGTGSFLSLSAIALRGIELIKATAMAKTMNFATNIGSVIIFLIYGQVIFSIGILMMLGQMIGAYIASHFLLRINPLHLRIIVIAMCFLMLIKYSFQMGWLG